MKELNDRREMKILQKPKEKVKVGEMELGEEDHEAFNKLGNLLIQGALKKRKFF